jgi:hypothetical protein
MTRLLPIALVGLLGCSSAPRPPTSEPEPVRDGGGSTDARADADASVDSGRQGSEGGSDAGVDGGQDAPSDAGDESPGEEAAVESGSGPPPPTAVCDPSATWGTGALIAVSTPSDDALDSITPDELTIAWTAGSGSTATVEYADRATSSDPYGAPQALAAGLFTTDRVSLSSDGLRLVVVNADGQGFSELVRAGRTSADAFGEPAVGAYANLDMPGALAAGQSYGDPVLAADDAVFYYSIYGGGQTTTMFRTSRLVSGDSWEEGTPLTASTGLAAQGSLRRRPTGISSDEQTLFFWDEVQGMERAAWIDHATGAFDAFVDLAARSMAAPNVTCTRLYYSSPGAASIDLFAAGD